MTTMTPLEERSRAATAEYGLSADCHSSAPVDRAGSIPLLCLPRCDSDASFARLFETRMAPGGRA
jgi:hypothetical protein